MEVDIKRISLSEIQTTVVSDLGFDSALFDIESIEVICAAIRRMASFLCPCSGATLVRHVVEPMWGIVSDYEAFKDRVEESLETLIFIGDLLEHSNIEEDSKNKTESQLYIAPSSFVARTNGTVILLGITPDQCSVLPSKLHERIEYKKHLRSLQPSSHEDISTILTEFGFFEISSDRWLRAPRIETPTQHLDCINSLLDSVRTSPEVPGLSLLDSVRPVKYYRGRWTGLKGHSGRFVGRRSQKYGADLWCYVQINNGTPERLLDLPLSEGLWRGCDEAWHLQMAIDILHGSPQRLRVIRRDSDVATLQLFSPIPSWAHRRWAAIGEPASNEGCLFAYRISATELPEELNFARTTLWLEIEED